MPAMHLLWRFVIVLQLMGVSLVFAQSGSDDDGAPMPPASLPCSSILETGWSLTSRAALSISHYKVLWDLMRQGLITPSSFKMSEGPLLDTSLRMPLDLNLDGRRPHFVSRSVLARPGHRLQGLDFSRSVLLITKSGLRLEAHLELQQNGDLQTKIVVNGKLYEVKIQWSHIARVVAFPEKNKTSLTAELTSYRGNSTLRETLRDSFYVAHLQHWFRVSGHTIWSAEFSPDGLSILTTTSNAGGGLSFWNSRNGRLACILDNEIPGCYHAVWSHDGQMVLVSGGTDKAASVWSLKTGQKIASHNKWHKPARFSVDNQSIISNFGIWNLITGEKRPFFDNSQYFEFAHSYHVGQSSDGALVMRVIVVENQSLNANGNGSIEIIDSKTGHQLRTIPLNNGLSSVSAYFVPQTHYVLVRTWSANDSFVLYDADTGLAKSEFKLKRLRHPDLSLSPDGKMMAAVVGDNGPSIYAVDTGQWLLSLPAISGLRPSQIMPQFSRQGDRILAGFVEENSSQSPAIGVFQLLQVVAFDLVD